ncbi:MAG TPA: YdeI/OmpD-associated family protein [Candidatus Eisenbacteria bacterium]|nr:YdeI/OmpD-associated family protein [Candidatus Eisenbacteria bacterium]
MGKRTKEVDAYIAKAPAFAKPILKEIRDRMHEGCPEVEEVLKWSVPHFDYKGPLAGMAAFKAHASFGFWKTALLKDPKGLLKGEKGAAMGGRRLTSVKDLLPKSVMRAFIKQAVALNEAGVKPPSKARGPAKRAAVPADLAAALKRNRKARDTFEKFSPSHRNEYIEWITEAKQDATRERRLAQAIVWMAEGKPRNWKYQR